MGPAAQAPFDLIGWNRREEIALGGPGPHKKRKAIPNPNTKFISLGEILISGETISDVIYDSNIIEAE